MVAIAISPVALSACQVIGGYAAYDASTGKYYAVAESHATDQFGMWCPTEDGFGWDWDNPVETPPNRMNLKRIDVPTFDEPRVGRVTDEEIKWRDYRRGTFYECPELGKEIQ